MEDMINGSKMENQNFINMKISITELQKNRLVEKFNSSTIKESREEEIENIKKNEMIIRKNLGKIKKIVEMSLDDKEGKVTFKNKKVHYGMEDYTTEDTVIQIFLNGLTKHEAVILWSKIRHLLINTINLDFEQYGVPLTLEIYKFIPSTYEKILG